MNWKDDLRRREPQSEGDDCFTGVPLIGPLDLAKLEREVVKLDDWRYWCRIAEHRGLLLDAQEKAVRRGVIVAAALFGLLAFALGMAVGRLYLMGGL